MKKRYLGDFIGFSNNLGFLRIIAAIMVIFSHSYTITGSGWDLLDTITQGTISLGGLAVIIFLFSSGYFVTGSIIKVGNGKKYFWGRFSRLYPAFFTVIVLSAFVLGPIVSTYSISEYFRSQELYSYLLYLLMIPRYTLPGVFTYNLYANNVNGSLWTMTLETIAYVFLFVLWKCKALNKKSVKILFPIFIVFVIIAFVLRIPVLYQYHAYLRPFCVFIMGGLFYIYRDAIPVKWTYILVGIGGLIVCFVVGCCDLGMVVFLPYLLATVIFAEKQLPKCLGDLGKYSYFIYLVAFPVQQTLQNYYHDMSMMNNFLWSFVISLVIGVAGYYLVEKPGGKLINRICKKEKIKSEQRIENK